MVEGGAEKYKYKITVIVTAFIMVCYVFQTRIVVNNSVYGYHENRVDRFSNPSKIESMKLLKSLSGSQFLKFEDIRSPSSIYINIGMIVINNKNTSKFLIKLLFFTSFSILSLLKSYILL